MQLIFIVNIINKNILSTLLCYKLMRKEYIFNNFFFKLHSWSPGVEYNEYKHILHNNKLTLNQTTINIYVCQS